MKITKAHIIKNTGLIFFSRRELLRTAKSPTATIYGVLTVILAGAAIGISQKSTFMTVFLPAALLVAFTLIYLVFHITAKCLFGGKGTEERYFRSLSNCFMVYWIVAIPYPGIYLHIIATLWLMLLNVYILKKIHKLSIFGALALGLLPLVIYALITYSETYKPYVREYLSMFQPSTGRP